MSGGLINVALKQCRNIVNSSQCSPEYRPKHRSLSELCNRNKKQERVVCHLPVAEAY